MQNVCTLITFRHDQAIFSTVSILLEPVGMTPDEMKARTKRFALDTIRFCRTLPRTDEARVGVAVEESDESAYWLELLLEANLVTRVRMAALHGEAEALTRMFAKVAKRQDVDRVSSGVQPAAKRSTQQMQVTED